jgi:exosortase/archaeosortase family protein
MPVRSPKQRRAFAVRVVVSLAAAFATMLLLAEVGIVDAICRAFAQASTWFARLFGAAADVHDVTIAVQGSRMRFLVEPMCAGLLAIPYLVALSVSIRGSWTFRSVLLLVLAAAWTVANMARIGTVVAYGHGSMNTFVLLHDWIWPFVQAFTFTAAFLWARRVDGRCAVEPAQPAGAPA